MLQYLVILLDDTSVAYCHADNPLRQRNLMPLDTLRKAIVFGMKENLMIQYVYPDYELPEEYNEVIESIDHQKIGRDIVICNGVPDKITSENVVLRLSVADFIAHQHDIAKLLPDATRLNICLTDIEHFTDDQQDAYKQALATLYDVLFTQYIHSDKRTQINILTDLMLLTDMNNCGAGATNITVAPNGRFYICPAFYYDEQTGVDNRLNHRQPSSERSVGDLDVGLQIPNQQLLHLSHAPLCRFCDAYHCNRCVWLNQKLTWDINTPSHQQCVLAHLERNATRDFQLQLKDAGMIIDNEIRQINYLDPFDVRKEN